MGVNWTHQIWIWALCIFLFCVVLVDIFSVPVPKLVEGVFAALTILFVFVTIGGDFNKAP